MVELFSNAITPSCQRSLEFLARQSFINDFYLAGGTALALQLGHRISTDLDWFSSSRKLLLQERDLIRSKLASSKQLEVASEQDGMLYTRLFDTDVSFVYQHHPLIDPIVEYLGIHLASPIDIGLMKLAAVNSRGTRRDFIDLYCLRETISLDDLLRLSSQKYADRPSFQMIAVRALVYFDDAEKQPMTNMLTPVVWADVRAYCEDAARRFSRRLSGLG